jgi:hypothetical protein
VDAKEDWKRIPGQPGAQVSMNEAFWRTVIADRMLGKRLGCSATDLERIGAYSPFENVPFPPSNEAEYSTFLNNSSQKMDTLNSSCTDQCLFMTANGFIGLGFGDVHAGDIVALPIGEHVPYVVRERPDSGGYQLICDCYLHGAMDGEIIEDLEAGRYQTQTFDLT